jgi:hypothetical protein
MSLSINHIPPRAVSPVAAHPPATDPPTLDGAALDAHVEALMTSGDAPERAQVICAVIEEMFAAVTWLQTQCVSPMESVSLRPVLNAAYDHRRRVSVSGVGPVPCVMSPREVLARGVTRW